MPGGAWRTLFDGKLLDAFRGYKGAAVPAGWKVADGALVKDTPVADIVSKDQFGDFELELEWKFGEAGNRKRRSRPASSRCGRIRDIK